ncbi:MAG TPA: hypothetical protein DEB40_12160 [Elusimicrobia bacterium]|nr:hypothetical protein [Elusimicrobiota bacterium]HBT62488.1 hypothetical protein [Elusimicrobiota bacterium]
MLLAALAAAVEISTVVAPAPLTAVAAERSGLGRQALRFLAGRAGDPDPDVRAAVAAAWGEIGNRAALPMLKKSVKDRNDYVRVEAAVSLHRLGQEQGRQALMTLVRSSAVPEGKLSAAQEMRFMARTKARAAALIRLSEMGNEDVVALMESTLSDPSGAVRDATAVALCRLGLDEEFSKQFLEAAQDKDDSVRAAAIKALGDAGLASARPALIAAAGDPSAAVRAEAVAALAAAVDQTLAPVFVERLKDENPRVRYLAAGGLSRISEDSAVAPVLRRLAADEKTPDLALKALAGLAGRGEKIDISLAERSLSANDIDGRMLALEVLFAAPGDESLRLLARVMDEDASVRVRVAAASMLVRRLQSQGGR